MGTIHFGLHPHEVSEADIACIRTIAPEMQVRVTHDRDEVVSILDDIEIAVAGFPRELLGQAPRLRWLQQWGAGADWLLRHPEAVEMDFVLTNASGVHAIPITEHILAFLLAFARQLHGSVRAQLRCEWLSHDERSGIFELAGKKLLLIGVGAIGGRTAPACTALGMHVQGIRFHPSIGAPGVEALFGPDQLDKLLPDADFVVLTVPLTAATKGMIGEPQLRAMKPTAYLINIGRGGTIQESALIRGLREGWIAGAGLDVFETEPLPADSHLWGFDNVIITGHYAGATPVYTERAMGIFMENLRRYRAGEPLHNVVDKRLGY